MLEPDIDLLRLVGVSSFLYRFWCLFFISFCCHLPSSNLGNPAFTRVALFILILFIFVEWWHCYCSTKRALLREFEWSRLHLAQRQLSFSDSFGLPSEWYVLEWDYFKRGDGNEFLQLLLSLSPVEFFLLFFGRKRSFSYHIWWSWFIKFFVRVSLRGQWRFWALICLGWFEQWVVYHLHFADVLSNHFVLYIGLVLLPFSFASCTTVFEFINLTHDFPYVTI